MDLNNSTTPEDEKDRAQTPWYFIKRLEELTHLKIELDVCAEHTTAKCSNYYTEGGTIKPWQRVNFCNPPYSDIKPWLIKANKEALKGNTTFVLIPDKPETSTTKLAREIADTVIHMPYRLNFIRPCGNNFLDKAGKKSGPKFPVCVYIITPHGLFLPVRDAYYDFRETK